MHKGIIYIVEVETSQDFEIAKKEFNANYALLKYHKDNKYHDISVVMGLSRNDRFMSKIINANQGKRGRPKKEFVRDEKSGFYHTSIPHEKKLHQHIYIASNSGAGAAMVASKMTKTRRKKGYICDNYKYKGKGIPLNYVEEQSIEFRTIGNYQDYVYNI